MEIDDNKNFLRHNTTTTGVLVPSRYCFGNDFAWTSKGKNRTL